MAASMAASSWVAARVLYAPAGSRGTAVIPATSAHHDVYDRQHHRYFHKHTDHRGERCARLEAEQRDCRRNRQLEKVGGADQRRGTGDAMLDAQHAVEP